MKYNTCTFMFVFTQYNKQHLVPLEDVKLQSLENDGRKCSLHVRASYL